MLVLLHVDPQPDWWCVTRTSVLSTIELVFNNEPRADCGSPTTPSNGPPRLIIKYYPNSIVKQAYAGFGVKSGMYKRRYRNDCITTAWSFALTSSLTG